MEAIPHPIPRTVEEVFSDFKGRRAGLIKALTADVEKFYQQCDPEKENLSLFGLPNETWEVNLPVEEVPPELPEPVLGINFARDGMQEKDWLSLVAVHSDSWLLAVAFYFGARFGFGKNERKKLFQMINDLPTIFEVVTGNAKQPKDPYLLNPFSGSRILRNFSGRCGSSWRWLQPVAIYNDRSKWFNISRPRTLLLLDGPFEAWDFKKLQNDYNAPPVKIMGLNLKPSFPNSWDVDTKPCHVAVNSYLVESKS
ncbi:PHD finger protein ALFIN-LIKE 7 [Citrus sinensis]|nr:PHD finger protein ALFIN-LIKE 7 [Citrus sinensis]